METKVVPPTDQPDADYILPSVRKRKSEMVKDKAKKCCTMKNMKKRLPILEWIRGYSLACLAGDLVAGFTVGLMVIPQGLAYGVVAGLTPNYGLYSSFCGSFLYILFGSTKELSIGPTAIMALMTYQYTSEGGVAYAVMLCFLSGIIEIVSGIINLGFLINFISTPVISGFTSAAAITIASSQLKPLFGIKVKTRGVIDTWVKVIQNITDLRYQDLILGLICIVILSVMKPLRTMKFPCVDPESKSIGQKILKQVIFFLSVGRNAIVVIIASLIAFSVDGDNQPFSLTGYVQAGIPPLSLPAFSTEINNRTVTFPEMLSDMGIGIIMVPFISMLDNIAVVGAFAKGKTFDANQEIFVLGIGTLIGSFFGSMPITASLSRTAVNLTSGVRTPLGGLVTGIMVLLALSFITPAFYYIPKSTLAAVIICAVLHMVDYEIVRPLWKSKRLDIIPLAVTFFACLGWGLEWGILLGIAVNLCMLLYSFAKPDIKVEVIKSTEYPMEYILVTPTRGVNYPNVSYIRTAIRKAGIKKAEGNLPVVVDCCFIDDADYTSAKGMKGMIADFEKRGQTLIFIGMKPSVMKTIKALNEDIVTCPDMRALKEVIVDETKKEDENIS